jgi:hypothetical protein
VKFAGEEMLQAMSRSPRVEIREHPDVPRLRQEGAILTHPASGSVQSLLQPEVQGVHVAGAEHKRVPIVGDRYDPLMELAASAQASVDATPETAARPIPELAEKLIDGVTSLNTVAVTRHPPLLSRIQSVKKELIFGHHYERARRCHRLVKQLHIADSSPRGPRLRARTALSSESTSFRLPSISSYSDRSGSPESALLKTQSDLEAAERFWDLELMRFNEMRKHATEALLQQQECEVAAVEKLFSPVFHVEVSSAQALRRKAEATTSQGQIKELNARADRIDAMEFEFAKNKRSVAVRRRADVLRERHVEDLAEFDRVWDTKLAKLKAQMKQDLAGKIEILAKSRAPSRAIASRQERNLFRKSCPTSIIDAISPDLQEAMSPITESEDEAPPAPPPKGGNDTPHLVWAF